MVSTAAGPLGVFLSGIEYEMADAQARLFVDAGAAVPLTPLRSPSVEQAVAPRPAEAAVASASPSFKRGKGWQKGR